jgi:hypothetical protein
MTIKTTTLRLSRPFEADGRWVEAVAFSGPPRMEPIPMTVRDGAVDLDTREIVFCLSKRTGLSMASIEKMDQLDRSILMLVLFSAPSSGHQGKKS